jgi:MerR family mercuric resistance operon transcriptional regulator
MHIIRIISGPPVVKNRTTENQLALRTPVQTYTQGMEGLTTAKLANEGGVNVETIRYYERHGLLPKPPRTHSGYRIFSDDAVRRLHFIKHAQDLGFSLKEIKELLSLKVKPGSSCGDVRRRAEAKIVDVDQKIQHLQEIKGALVELTSACSGQGPASRCTILQALNDRGTP